MLSWPGSESWCSPCRTVSQTGLRTLFWLLELFLALIVLFIWQRRVKTNSHARLGHKNSTIFCEARIWCDAQENMLHTSRRRKIGLLLLGKVQASPDLRRLAWMCTCLYAYVQWWCIVIPVKSHGRSLQLGQHPTPNSRASPEGKPMSQLSGSPKIVHNDHFQGYLRSSFLLPVWRGKMSGRHLPVFGRAW